MSVSEVMDSNRLQLQSSTPEKPGDLGFKLIGESKKKPGKLLRLWVRRKIDGERHVWHRYLDPRAQSKHWEVRLHKSKDTGAMTLMQFSLKDLEGLAEDYNFPSNPPTRDALKAVENDDPVFNAVRDWVLQVTEG